MRPYLTAINEWFGGVRGILAVWFGVFLASIPDIVTTVQTVFDAIGVALGPDGAAAATVATVMTAKLAVTDFWRKVKERVAANKAPGAKK